MSFLLKLILPVVGRVTEVLVTMLLKLITDWLEQKRQDKIDAQMKKRMRDNDRVIVAGDLDRSFE